MIKVWNVLTFLSILLLLNLLCLSQSRERTRIYEVISIDTVTNAKGEDQTVTQYEYKGIPVTVLEQYYSSKDKQEKGLEEAMQGLADCTKKTVLTDKKGTIVGNKYLCSKIISGGKFFVLGYSYFDSLNKTVYIEGKSTEIIEKFAKGICPLAFQLYNDPECPEFPD